MSIPSETTPKSHVTLDNCADEPIHIPGSIQPYGSLLVFDAAGLLEGWSANAADMLCMDLAARQPLSKIGLPPGVTKLILKCIEEMVDGETVPGAILASFGARQFDCITHAHNGRVLAEFELRDHPAEEVDTVALLAQAAAARLKRKASTAELMDLAVKELRAITGFDRVMAYRFRDDESGEVMAEAHLPSLVPFLGQRYPASDIPAQARRLYVINTLRSIVDVSYDPVPVLMCTAATDLDMSHCGLRSVSPIHVEYLQNMGVGASMSISILMNGQLWGLIACHHTHSRKVPYPVRLACDMLVHVIASAALSHEVRAQAAVVDQSVLVRAELMNTLSQNGDILPMLHRHVPALSALFGSDAIVLAYRDEIIVHGALTEALAHDMVASLTAANTLVRRDSIDDWAEEMRPLLGKWVGLLGLCFDPAGEGWILAVRIEQIELVRWGGRPEKFTESGPSGLRLTPRGSFDEWSQTVVGQCEPWSAMQVSIATQLLADFYRIGHVDLTKRATHDALTGLPNRVFLLERMGSALARSRRVNLGIALLFIDLDGFKLVNDTHGHDAGDRVLTTVALRLLIQVRAGEMVARLSGDEFVVLCEQVDEPAAVAALAERIKIALAQPMDAKEGQLFVTASIGVAMGRGDAHTGADMLRRADAAMYAAKQAGRNGWKFFDELVDALAQERIHITQGLRGAIERDELSVRFQPIVIADSARIVGAELLLRWFPASGEISPSVFIPVAEVTGSILPIGAWVLAQACRAEVAWRGRWGVEAPYVSVNVSTKQLNDASLVDDVGALLRDTEADPRRIVLEITETALMTDVGANLRVLRQLADLGLRVAVDDFGTGYSSLAQLSRMPVSILKIDRAFVDGLDTSPESRAVIRAIISLGRELGLTTVAEGVETPAQQLELCAYGCDFAQGYHFHRPMVEAAFIDTVERELYSGAQGGVTSLHFIIYVSEATGLMPPSELDVLLRQTRVSNRAAAVTGCLLFHEGCFMQMLEGPKDVVQALYAKIHRDSRHRNVALVIEGRARRRVFADWSMILRDLTLGENGPDFDPWQKRSISFLELSQDARTCYAYITGYIQGPNMA